MSTSPIIQEPRPEAPSRFNRRMLVTSTAAAGLAGVTGVGLLRIAQAQDGAATPDPTTDATTDEASSTGTPGATSGNDTTFASVAIDRVNEAIASVQADRDAAGSDIDFTEIDSLITRAGIHRDLVQTALDASDNAEAVRQAFVAVGSARAARALIETGLDHPGLPSDEVRASRTLTRVHAGIVAVTADAASATDPNVAFFVSHAQTLYTTAFDLNETGAFAQATGTGRVAGDLARIAIVLTSHIGQIDVGRGGYGGGLFGGGRRGPGHGGLGVPGMPGMPGMGGMFDKKMDRALDDGSDTDATPEAVPAPEF